MSILLYIKTVFTKVKSQSSLPNSIGTRSFKTFFKKENINHIRKAIKKRFQNGKWEKRFENMNVTGMASLFSKTIKNIF